jgi:radical SAM superfamily enzyme YgiQ (UPF0313 family)
MLLINPTISGEPEALNIALVTIGSYLQQHSEHRARVIDFAFYRGDWKGMLRRELETYDPSVVGMYVTTPYFPCAKMVAREIKRLNPRVPIVAGGHHATLSPEQTIAEDDIDFLIVGEGERAAVRLLNSLRDKSPLDEVPNLVWKENGQVRRTPKGRLLEAEEIPALDWRLYDEDTLRKSFYFWGTLPIMGSRGCPYNCSFCAITNVQKLYKGEKFLRFRDPVSVVDELDSQYEQFKDLGMRVAYFFDLNFLIRQDWLSRFTAEYKRRGLNVRLPFSAYTRADHVVPETMSALKDSGCIHLRVGIEAANPQMLNDYYNNELPQEKLLRALRAIKEAGIGIQGYFLTGGPGERPEWLMESLELAYRQGIEYPTFFLYKPLAGTDILDRASAMGSYMDLESMEQPADFLHGVNMVHRYISRRQIIGFHFLTQVIFGLRIVAHQIPRERTAYFGKFFRYFFAAVRHGFTPYQALIYFTFYGHTHLTEGHRFPLVERPALWWRVLRRLLSPFMRSLKKPPRETSRMLTPIGEGSS